MLGDVAALCQLCQTPMSDEQLTLGLGRLFALELGGRLLAARLGVIANIALSGRLDGLLGGIAVGAGTVCVVLVGFGIGVSVSIFVGAGHRDVRGAAGGGGGDGGIVVRERRVGAVRGFRGGGMVDEGAGRTRDKSANVHRGGGRGEVCDGLNGGGGGCGGDEGGIGGVEGDCGRAWGFMLLAPLWAGPRSSAVIGLSPSAVPTAQWPQTRVSCSCALAVTSHPPSARIHPPRLPFFPGPPSHRSRHPPAFRTADTCSGHLISPFFCHFSLRFQPALLGHFLCSGPTARLCAPATSCASVPSDPSWSTRVTPRVMAVRNARRDTPHPSLRFSLAKATPATVCAGLASPATRCQMSI